jgi:CelD/BcsL family acetyltransferase involved in cellulose biosynthesis
MLATIRSQGRGGAECTDDQPIPSAVEVRIFDPLGDSDWDRLVISHPECNFFHSAAWAKVICQTYGHKSFYLCISDRGKLVALVPFIEVRSPFTSRRGVCLPFADSCSPLVFDKKRSTLVMDEVSKLARERKWKHFEIRGLPLQAFAQPTAVFYGHRLDLRQGSEEVFGRFRTSTRGAIRKAAKSNLDVQVLRTRDSVLQFYRLHVQTRRRHGLPPQPVSFFLNIHENVIKPGLGFAVLARAGVRTIAGAIFFRFAGQALYKFGASDEKFERCRGNNLVMWEAIKFLMQQGSEILHFGRTALDNEGLRRFKQSWGTEEEVIGYYRFNPVTGASMPLRHNVSGLHNKIFSRLPLALNRVAGAMIYPHLD